MPDDEGEADFRAFTCGVSKFVRKGKGEEKEAPVWKGGDEVPFVDWKGRGVGGGWTCEINGSTGHLTNGGERDWYVCSLFC